MAEETERPLGVTLLVILNLIAALMALIRGSLILLLGLPYGSALLMGIALAYTVFGAIELLVAYGLWKGKVWAWWLALIIALLNFFSIIWGNVPAFIVGGIALICFTRSDVRKFFGITY